MSHNSEIKRQAIKLRQNGYSIKDIAQQLHIAHSTSSLWLRQVSITRTGLQHMRDIKALKRLKMSQRWQQKRAELDNSYIQIASTMISNVVFTSSITKVMCATLFWAEGSKQNNHVAFTNSDPKMITTFLYLMRSSFTLDESKFRVSAHLHEYHNTRTTLEYWSQVTKIPQIQFIKPYLKPHTAIRKHADYKGCVTIRYYDYKIARELTAIYNALGEKFRGVVQW